MVPSVQQSPVIKSPPLIPPLENGDQLTREEFERRYDATPNLKKAELLEGMVHMPSPVRLAHHGRPHRKLATWFGTYEAATPGVAGADNCTVRLDLENEPQPDGILFILPEHGGQARISDDDYVEGAPELAAEITASNVSIALTTKLRVYRRNNVREYVVWRVQDNAIDWFVLQKTQYEQLVPDAAGYYRSAVFPGLWLDPAAMIGGDMARVLQVLQQGLATPEHAAFVARLRAAQGTPPA